MTENLNNPVQALLIASAAVTAIVGDRIYKAGMAPQDVQRPYITMSVISNLPQLNVTQAADSDDRRIQIDVWHPDEKQARLLAQAVQDAIEEDNDIIFGPVDGYDAVVRMYRWTMDAEFWTGR